MKAVLKEEKIPDNFVPKTISITVESMQEHNLHCHIFACWESQDTCDMRSEAKYMAKRIHNVLLQR